MTRAVSDAAFQPVSEPAAAAQPPSEQHAGPQIAAQPAETTRRQSTALPGIGRVLVCIPTYNERDSLPETVRRLRAAVPAVDILVIDDGSPDGTGELADSLAAQDPAVNVLHRTSKAGLGAAYIAGFSWGMQRGYDALVEMDADGSHQPEELPRLLDALREADVVLGSRWVPGGEVHNWPASRLWLSRGGNAYVRLALGMPLRDATGGYRAYRRQVLEALPLAEVASQGYCFQVDLVWQAWRSGFDVTEVPITFVERAMGESKMSRSIVLEAFWRVAWWGLRTGRKGPEPTERTDSADGTGSTVQLPGG